VKVSENLKRPAIFPALLLLLCTPSCTTVALTPFGKGENYELQEDEQRLWALSAEEQKRLEKSSRLYNDPVLINYLNGVAQRLVPKEVLDEVPAFRIKVINNPLVNAFAYPNGVIYVHTGFLAKMENEAQLATVLAHEISHVIHRHAVQGFRNLKNTAAFLTTLKVIGAPAGLPGLGAMLLGAIGAMAAVSGYSKAAEEEADSEGLKLLVKAGYDPQEAPRIFDLVKRDLEEREINEPFFFGSHPHLQERKDSYAHLLNSHFTGIEGDKGTERFTKVIQPLLLDNAQLDLAMGRFALTEEAISKFLKQDSQSARAHFLLGEVFRQRDKAEDRSRAEKQYLIALGHDFSHAESYKALGLIYLKNKEKTKAKVNFEKYLSLVPEAKDKGYIEQYLQEIAQEMDKS
jgi:tetratricopeptide (TPR) repeat protein